MTYIEARNKFILSVNKPELKKMPDFFTPDDVASFVGLAVKEYIGKEKVSLLDPMGGSGNLFYHVIKIVGKDNFNELKINRFKQKGEDKELYQTITNEISKFKGNDKYSISISNHTVVKSKDKADFVIANLDGNFLGNHEVIQYITNKYCFILDTNSPKNNIKFDKENFSIEKIIFLGDKIGIEGKKYYLYIYKKEKSGIKDFKDIFYNFSGLTKEYNKKDNIFIGKKNELILGKKSFNELIEKSTLDVQIGNIIPINEVLQEIYKSNSIISSNFIKLIGNTDYQWQPSSDYKILDIINNIQSSGQKIKSKKLYEILISLTASNFIILSGPSGVGKTSLIEKIALNIGGKYLKSPIKSNFTDEGGLLGYWNPLLSKYEGTEVLDFIFQSANAINVPFFLLLDEMNLSRIENYFSEFLIKIDDLKNGSIEIKLFETFVDTEAKFNNIKYFIEKYNLTNNEIEVNGCSFSDIKIKYFNEIGNFSVKVKINIYSNLHIIGTINEDETTFSLSNKVLDRAFYIELGVDNLFEDNSRWEDTKVWDDGKKWEDENLPLSDKFIKYIDINKNYFDITQKTKGNIQSLESYKFFFNDLNKIIQKINPMDAIGYRSIYDIARFFDNYNIFINNSVLTTEDGFNIITEDGKDLSLDSIVIENKILDIVLCQKVWQKINNYFLLGDKENEFNEILKLLEKNIGKDTRSYKKVSEVSEFLFNN